MSKELISIDVINGITEQKIINISYEYEEESISNAIVNGWSFISREETHNKNRVTIVFKKSHIKEKSKCIIM